MYKRVLLSLLTGLVGCQNTMPVEIPKEVKVIVSVPCLKEMPAAPSLRGDEELLGLGRYHRTIAMWDERRVMQDEIAQDRALMQACIGGSK